jgi:hypothetical protein
LRFWPHEQPLIVHAKGAGIEIRADVLIQTVKDGIKKFYVFFRADDKAQGCPDLLLAFLGEADINLRFITPSGEVTQKDAQNVSVAPGALFVPWIKASQAKTELRQVSGLNIPAECPEDMAGLFACLQDHSLAAKRTMYLSWGIAGGSSVALSFPARMLESSHARIVILEEKLADPFLVALVSLKGYRCFALRELQ